MLAGIIIQMVALFFFMCLGAQFFYCFLTDRPIRAYAAPTDNSTLTLTNRRRSWNNKLKLLSAALAFSSLVLMIRCVPLSLSRA